MGFVTSYVTHACESGRGRKRMWFFRKSGLGFAIATGTVLCEARVDIAPRLARREIELGICYRSGCHTRGSGGEKKEGKGLLVGEVEVWICRQAGC